MGHPSAVLPTTDAVDVACPDELVTIVDSLEPLLLVDPSCASSQLLSVFSFFDRDFLGAFKGSVTVRLGLASADFSFPALGLTCLKIPSISWLTFFLSFSNFKWSFRFEAFPSNCKGIHE